MFVTQKPAIFAGASRLGFGCASLGSRIGSRRGLMALEKAFERGINWFDLAPSYGDGMAELIFSGFAKVRRDKLFICTKVGITVGAISPLAKILKPAARAAVQYFPQLRDFAGRGRQAALSLPLTAALILNSLDNSLRRLGTDYVDVLSLHDPSLADLERDDIAIALEQAAASGKARSVGIAGTVEAARAAVRLGLPVSHLQFACRPCETTAGMGLSHDESIIRALIVTHSVFGRSLPSPLAKALVNQRELVVAQLAKHGYNSSLPQAIYDLLFDCCLQSNADGVVLISMFSPAHLERNMSRIQFTGQCDAIALLRNLERLPAKA